MVTPVKFFRLGRMKLFGSAVVAFIEAESARAC